MSDEKIDTATAISQRQIHRTDFRRLRAGAFTAAVMQEISDLIPAEDEIHREFYHRLHGLFYKNGASIMTDEDRAKEGFEPRDAQGWTPSERVADKLRQAQAMQMMVSAVYMSPMPKD